MREQDVVAWRLDERFGVTTVTERALKLAEEAGEVAGATIRHGERRDGRTWEAEIAQECGDVYVTLLAVIDAVGADAESVFNTAVERFLERT